MISAITRRTTIAIFEFANDKCEVITQIRNLQHIGNIRAGKKLKFVLKPNREIPPYDIEVRRNWRMCLRLDGIGKQVFYYMNRG